MTGELVRVRASDGLELVGYYAAPDGDARRAVLHVHGMAGNFYENRFVSTVCRAVLAKGLAFLTVNNRGHDYRSDNLKDEGLETISLLGGASFDDFGDCVHDIGGGAAFLSERGHEGIYFEGHSLATNKIVYYLTSIGDARATGVILISPPDIFALHDVRSEGRRDEVLASARALVEAGVGDTLMGDAGYVVPLSARTVVSMYGDEAVSDIFPVRLGPDGDYSRLGSLAVPILATLGTVDEAITVPTEDAVHLITTHATSAPEVEVVAVPGANHVYWGHEDELAEIIGCFVRP